MGWNSEIFWPCPHSSMLHPLKATAEKLAQSLNETRTQGYHFFKAAEFISAWLDSCRSQRNCTRPEQGHIFLRTGLVDSLPTFKHMHTDTQIWPGFLPTPTSLWFYCLFSLQWAKEEKLKVISVQLENPHVLRISKALLSSVFSPEEGWVLCWQQQTWFIQ